MQLQPAAENRRQGWREAEDHHDHGHHALGLRALVTVLHHGARNHHSGAGHQALGPQLLRRLVHQGDVQHGGNRHPADQMAVDLGHRPLPEARRRLVEALTRQGD